MCKDFNARYCVHSFSVRFKRSLFDAAHSSTRELVLMTKSSLIGSLWLNRVEKTTFKPC